MRERVLLVAAVVSLSGAVWFWRCLPNPLFSDPVSSVLLARNGDLLGAKIADDGQWRFPLGGDLPEKYKTALIAFEDKRFRYHPGVDVFALARAIYQNFNEGEVVSGASTITMQVIRLAREKHRRSYLEKAIEMMWAVRLELGTSKDDILALYSAHAPFGGNVIGLEAAAWRYFGRGPENLSWAEASLLAVLPNNPALVHPGRNRSRLEEKRNALLRRLFQKGAIDETELRLALLEPLPEKPHPLPQLAPHLLASLTSNNRSGDYRLNSTLTAPLQRSVSNLAERHSRMLELRGVRNVAVLVLDNRSFETLAYVGNSRWSVNEGSGYAIDLIHRPRSTGSILKPLLFARMLDAGEIVPQTLVPDLPTQFAGYMPENYDGTYRGAVPATQALARSLNVPAVRMLREHGVDRFYDFLTNAGMSTLTRTPNNYGLTLILGGAEGTLWDLTGIYANLAHLARSGSVYSSNTYRQPTALLSRPTSTENTAEMSPGAAWLTLEALVEVVRPGLETNWRDFGNSQKIAWKTGTSFGRRDAWAIGSSGKYTVGVWVGNASGEGRPELTGVGMAAPLLFGVFNVLDDADWFPTRLATLREIEVCKNDGYLPSGGCERDSVLIPVDAHFERVSPFHRTVHLDASERWRVNGRCETTDNMVHRSWFVLPAGQEHYYRKYQTSYRRLPPFREDCVRYATAGELSGPMDFLYPNTGTRIYIPIELSGAKGRVVFEAAHRDPDATLFWHLDNEYLGTTKVFHEQALDVGAGFHTITVVDGLGNRLFRRFEVLSKTETN